MIEGSYLRTEDRAKNVTVFDLIIREFKIDLGFEQTARFARFAGKIWPFVAAGVFFTNLPQMIARGAARKSMR
jgi:hypothetical protein